MENVNAHAVRGPGGPYRAPPRPISPIPFHLPDAPLPGLGIRTDPACAQVPVQGVAVFTSCLEES